MPSLLERRSAGAPLVLERVARAEIGVPLVDLLERRVEVPVALEHRVPRHGAASEHAGDGTAELRFGLLEHDALTLGLLGRLPETPREEKRRAG